MSKQYYLILVLIFLYIYIKAQLIIFITLAIIFACLYIKYKKKTEPLVSLNDNDILPGQPCLNDSSCESDSKCMLINPKYGKVCTAGLDGTNPVSVNEDNGFKHYLPANIKACEENNSNLECSPHYKCHKNRCYKKLFKKSKWVKKYYDPANPGVFKWEKEHTIYHKIKPKIIDKKVKSDRLNFIPSMPLNRIEECPSNHSLFIDKNKQYCEDLDNKENICRLDVDGNRKYELCSSVTCPDEYIFKNNLCEHKVESTKKCTLDPLDNSNYPVCGDLNAFIPFKNTDIDENDIGHITDVNKDICAYECNKNLKCDSFVITDNMTLTNCKLKQTPTSVHSVVPNNTKTTYFRNPLNYSYYDNTNVHEHTIKSYDVETPYSCSKLCDDNTGCSGFVIDKENLKCELKKTFGTKTEFSDHKSLFKKNYTKGELCKTYSQKETKEKIKENITILDNLAEHKLEDLTDEYNKKLQNLKISSHNNAMKKIINIFGNTTNTITWDGILTSTKEILIRNTESKKMLISFIQIIGLNPLTKQKINIIQDKNTTIHTNNDNDIDQIKEESLETFGIFKNILINTQDEHIIHRIIIYNYDKTNNLPLEITLFNEKEFIEKQWIQKDSESAPVILGYDNITFKSKVYDKGNPQLFNSYANLLGTNTSSDYCRFVDNDKKFCCKHNNSDSEYDVCVDSDKLLTNYPKTYFFNKNQNTNKDDLCWCNGVPPNNTIKCIQPTENSFSNSYNLQTSISNCSNLDGKTLKQKIKLMDSYINLNPDAGFYWDKTNSFYLFKNSTLNTNKILLYTILDADTFIIKKGFPKIVNNITFPGLTINKKITSILYGGNDIVYFIYKKIYSKYNLKLKKEENGFPKNINYNWKSLLPTFNGNISNSIYMNPTNCLLFNKIIYINYNLSLINSTNLNQSNIQAISYNLKNKFSKLKSLNYNCILYNYTDNIYLFFYNNTCIVLNDDTGLKKEFLIETYWKNIWKFN